MFEKFVSNIVNQIEEKAAEPIRRFTVCYEQFGVVDDQTRSEARAAIGMTDQTLERFLTLYRAIPPIRTLSFHDICDVAELNSAKD